MAPKFCQPQSSEKSSVRFKKAGFYIHEQTGSHVHLKHPSKPGRNTVPNHERFGLPKHIIKSIIRQAGLTNQEFFDLLNQ